METKPRVKPVTFKLNKEFRRLYGRGKSFVHPALVTYIIKTGAPTVRYGITVSKKLGHAVERNRAKRIITAAWRELAPQLNQHIDVVFVARHRILSMKSTDVAAILERQFIAAGLLPVKNHEVDPH